MSGGLGSAEGGGAIGRIVGDSRVDVLTISSGAMFSAGGVVVKSPSSVAVKVWIAKISDQLH